MSMTLDEYIEAFKSGGKHSDPNRYAPTMTSDEYKNYKKMPDSEFRNFIDKLASGTPQEDKKAKEILSDMGFYEANPRRVGRFSQTQIDMLGKPLQYQLETARKAGYVQGVCECVAVVSDDHTLGKKLLSEMQVTKDMAKKFANPQTYKALEQSIFTPPQVQKIEQTHSRKL
jgi:hypothetical protein